MSRGNSGRVVIEIDPSLKRELYSELVREGKTLKEWFLREVQDYLVHGRQAQLFAAEPPGAIYRADGAANE